MRRYLPGRLPRLRPHHGHGGALLRRGPRGAARGAGRRLPARTHHRPPRRAPARPPQPRLAAPGLDPAGQRHGPRARRPPWAAVVPVLLWVVAATVAVQWLAWVVEYVRRGPRGELVVRPAAAWSAGMVVVVATGHLVDATAWTPAAWASTLPLLGARRRLGPVAARLRRARGGGRRPRHPGGRCRGADGDAPGHHPGPRRDPPLCAARLPPRRPPRARRHRPRQRLALAPPCAGGWSCEPAAGHRRLRRPARLAHGAGAARASSPPAGPCCSASTPGPSTRAARSGARACRCAPRTVLLARAWVLAEVLTVAAVATLLICGCGPVCRGRPS